MIVYMRFSDANIFISSYKVGLSLEFFSLLLLLCFAMCLFSLLQTFFLSVYRKTAYMYNCLVYTGIFCRFLLFHQRLTVI